MVEQKALLHPPVLNSNMQVRQVLLFVSCAQFGLFEVLVSVSMHRSRATLYVDKSTLVNTNLLFNVVKTVFGLTSVFSG